MFLLSHRLQQLIKMFLLYFISWIKLNIVFHAVLSADKVCNGEGTLALTPQCLQVLHESFERILSRRDSRVVSGSFPMSLNEFAGYRELSFMYDIIQVASSLKVCVSTAVFVGLHFALLQWTFNK